MNREYDKTAERQPDQIDPDYLADILARDGNLQNLTVVRLALKDLKNSSLDSAISRLKVDLDKIRSINPDLYSYLKNRI